MRSVRSVMMAFVLVAVCARGTAAQDSGKVGITMGYPASVGIIWQASDSIAIRPELSFTGSSTNTSTTTEGLAIEGDGWSLGTGVSALFYLHKYDQLRTYVSPRFTYAHNHTSTKSSSGTFSSNSTFSSSNVQFAGSFGAEYALSNKFSAFGEVGFGFGHSWSDVASSTIRPTTNTWGTRTGVGVTFYF